MACFVCIVYIKSSIDVSNLSIFRSIIHLNVKLCKKNNKNNKFSLKCIQHNSWGKIPCHGRDLGCDSAIIGAIPWDPR